MRCHICGKFVPAGSWERHLKVAHFDYYVSPAAYVRKEHLKKYGFEKGSYILSRFFGGKRMKMGNKGTISGMIMGFIGLLIFGVMANVFWPLMQDLVVDLDSDFQLLMNLAFIIIGVGIIVEIINDSTRGERPVYYGAPQ